MLSPKQTEHSCLFVYKKSQVWVLVLDLFNKQTKPSKKIIIKRKTFMNIRAQYNISWA